MYKYTIQINPGHNRVYYKESQKLSIEELKLAASDLFSRCESFAIENIKGVVGTSFTSEKKLTEPETNMLYDLSFVFVIFEVIDMDGETYLRPIENTNTQHFDDKITTILKYQGKTNETFTKLMIGLATHYCSTGSDNPLRLLDPMAGKGTTLFCGLTRGFDVYGIEISQKYTNEIGVFFKKYLEQERIKHLTQRRTITNRLTKKQIGKGQHFEFADKQDFADGIREKLEIVHGDATLVGSYYKKSYFDIIVTDLPYGIQHASKEKKQQKSTTRNPEQLLQQCLLGWYDVLKKGGALVVSYNVNVISKTKVDELLRNAGLSLCGEVEHSTFEHRVDAAIKRDVSIAKKGT